MKGNKAILFISLFVFQTGLLFGQTPLKEAGNSFALYTKKQDYSQLEKAKKLIDEAYKTRKDTLSYKTNLTRSLIYSTLAFVDSTRKLSYRKDPIEEALFSFGNLKHPKLNDEHEPEINFIKKQLANAFLIKANAALKEYNNEEAYDSYRWVDSLSSGNFPQVKHNLAVLSQKLGFRSRAIGYYEQLIKDKQTAQPSYFLTLSELHESGGNSQRALEIIRKGRMAYPRNEDLLFKELNTYADNGDYTAVTALIKDAIDLKADHLNLNYLAGFSYDIAGKRSLAEEYYKKVISLDPNNYDGNYSLGLLYLKLYYHTNKKQEDALGKAEIYLNKALEINPNAVKALKSLAILYKETGDMIKLEQVNNKLNQIILN